MERQCFVKKADEEEYQKLYRDTQPGQNVYWNGFGEPPTLTFRADFNDIEFNRRRQLDRKLIKGRFSGGNLGWIVPEDMELFLALYRKPLTKPTIEHLRVLELIETAGPFNIQQLKEETGLLVKKITPILHRLQEAFLIYEDQYDGEWDRGWYKFGEMFPEVNPDKYTRNEALKIVLQRFAYRIVWSDTAMAKSFYKLDLFFRKLIKGLRHGSIEPYKTICKSLQYDFKGFESGILIRIYFRKHLYELIPAAVPLAVILILINQKRFLQAVQSRCNLFHQQTCFFFDLLDVERSLPLNQLQHPQLYFSWLYKRLAIESDEQLHIFRYNPS